MFGYYGRPLAIMVRFPGQFFDTTPPPMALVNQSFFAKTNRKLYVHPVRLRLRMLIFTLQIKKNNVASILIIRQKNIIKESGHLPYKKGECPLFCMVQDISFVLDTLQSIVMGRRCGTISNNWHFRDFVV